MANERKLHLKEFVQAASPDTLRVTHDDPGWFVSSGDAVLMRPTGSTFFDTPQQVFRVLAGAGIRCAVIEWDGLDAITE